MASKRKLVIRLKSPWVIMWDWSNPSASLVDRFVAIQNYRKSKDYIMNLVEFIYNIHTSNLSELASYAKNKKNIPYKAESDINRRISCGSNPFLVAKQVQYAEVYVDTKTGIETIEWETYPTFIQENFYLKKLRDPVKERIVRKITGPLSFESLWDGERKIIKQIKIV